METIFATCPPFRFRPASLVFARHAYQDNPCHALCMREGRGPSVPFIPPQSRAGGYDRRIRGRVNYVSCPVR